MEQSLTNLFRFWFDRSVVVRERESRVLKHSILEGEEEEEEDGGLARAKENRSEYFLARAVIDSLSVAEER